MAPDLCDIYLFCQTVKWHCLKCFYWTAEHKSAGCKELKKWFQEKYSREKIQKIIAGKKKAKKMHLLMMIQKS
jgi:hypothetical protein